MLAGAGWMLLAAQAGGGDAAPVCALLALAVVSYLVGRLLTGYRGWLAPLLVGVGAGGLALAKREILLLRPHADPLGYSNATGSLFMLATAAALLLLVRVRAPALRAACACAAGAFAAVPWLNETDTALFLVVLLPLALLARKLWMVRVVVVVGWAAVLLSLLVVLILGWTYRPAERGGWLARMVDATLGERRLMLWSDAIDLFAAHPVAGVGPGRFPRLSPTAFANPDTAWPHSEPLHLAAEAGLPGIIFLLALVGWGFARLWWGAGDRGAAVAAAALGAVGVHASVE